MTHALRFAGLFLAAAVALAADGAPLPDTPLGRRVAAYVAAYNSGDEKSMAAFWTANFTAESLRERPVEARLTFYRRMRSDTKTIVPATVEESSASALAFLMKTPEGEWFRFHFDAEASPPHRLASMRVETVDAPPEKPAGPAVPSEAPKASDEQAAAAFDEYLRGLAAKDEFSGAVLLARDNTPFSERVYGLADREFNVPVSIETRFNLGSINKIFTKTAIAQLAAAGKLSLSDTIRKHLPRYAAPYADRVTILQLLNFSSGMGDIFGAKWDATPKENLRTLADYVPLFEGDPLKFEPGTSHAYSNAGYVLLGLIIEAVTAQDYYTYVRENIFRPAGMTDSDSYSLDDVVANRAVGYTKREGGRWRSNTFERPARGSSAGGGYSTVRDLLRFGAALKAGKLAPPAYSAWILSRTEGLPDAAPPGRISGSLGVAGGSPGVNAALLIDADRGYTVVVLCNGDPPVAEKALRKIRGLLPHVARSPLAPAS